MTVMTLTVLPYGESIEIKEGETILEAVRRAGHAGWLDAPCNGRHTCGKCKITVKSGSVSKPAAAELSLLTGGELESGVRLACAAAAVSPTAPLTVEIFSSKQMSGILKDGYMPSFTQDPIAVRKHCDYAEETGGGAPDFTALFSAVTGSAFPEGDLALLRRLPLLDGEKGFDAVYFDGVPAAIEPAGRGRGICGVAFDIGTTTVAASLLDLETGDRLSVASDINPQSAYGADVLSRIEHTMREDGGLEELQVLIAGCLDRLTLELLRQSGRTSGEVYAFSVAANTTMLHLLLGVAPRSIALAPYRPVFRNEQRLPAQSLGIKNCAPSAVLCCLPSISGYIGADILAGIEISGISDADGNALFIDIGTNGEIVLSCRGKLSSCSCAAGPALEGMNISCGMRASDGAIEKVAFHDGLFNIETIGNLPPAGLCGSGVLDALSALLKAGAVDPSGRVADPLPPALRAYAVINGRSTFFLLSGGDKPVYFTQSDIRQVQLAKGAILSGVVALVADAGLSLGDIDSVLIAGQFGAHLSEDSLTSSGLLPKEFQGKIRYVGNTSLSGAELYLLDKKAGGRMARTAGTVSYLELASYPDYTRLLMDSLKFPKFDQ